MPFFLTVRNYSQHLYGYDHKSHCVHFSYISITVGTKTIMGKTTEIPDLSKRELQVYGLSRLTAGEPAWD